MLSFSEAQITAWLSPLLWPFFRVLALFMTAPVLSSRAVPMRLKIVLAFGVTLAAQAALAPRAAIALDAPEAPGVLLQQLVVGAAIGLAARIVVAAVEYAGELVGLQMGLGFAAFFEPSAGGQANAVSRYLGTLAALLFIVLNGHLLLVAAVIQSFQAFPVAPSPMAFLQAVPVQRWGAELFRLGLWFALPVLAMLLFTNLVMGVISRVAQQLNIFAIGFPVTLGVGLLGLLLTLPLLEQPFSEALAQMLDQLR